MKKILSFVMVAMMALSMMVGMAAADEIKVGISFGTLQQEHWVKSKDIMQAVCDEQGITLLVQSANDDMQKQISQCENLITQGIDVLILQALDTEAAAPIIQTAHEANVPVIGFVRPVQNCDVDYFFGSNYKDCGVDQAEYAISVAPKGKYALIEGAPDDVNARVIHEGHIEVLQPYIDNGDIEIVYEQWCDNWSADDALRYIEDCMTSNNNDIQFIICANDAFAGAAVTVLNEQNLVGEIMMTGNDCDLTACQRIVEGIQGQTEYPAFPRIAEATINAAIQLAKTGDISEFTNGATMNNGFKDVPFGAGEYLYSVTAENMDLVYTTGWHKVEDIYANIPEEEWPDAAKEYTAANQ